MPKDRSKVSFLCGVLGVSLFAALWFSSASRAPVRADEAVAAVAGESRLPPPVEGWHRPRFGFFVTGRQHGYIEPCGCTGLANAKGGLSRRDTLLSLIKQRGWELVLVDVGNQVRRFGPQAEIKFQTTAALMKTMQYDAICFGPDDLKLSAAELAFAVGEASGENPFVCGNVDLFGLNGQARTVTVGGVKIGIAAALGTEASKSVTSSEIVISDPASGIEKALAKLRATKCQWLVLLAHTDLDETRAWARQFPQFDLIVTAGGAGEPTLDPETVQGSKARIVQVGTKGMYVGLIGVYPGQQPEIRYERVELDARFADSERVMQAFGIYQQQLKDMGLAGLGLQPSPHPLGKDRKFVGHEVCGECHTQAYDIFVDTPHAHATDSIANPTERSNIPRHFDPECLSCHVTGWNAQQFFPYVSGYLDLEDSAALHSNGCENCHGPGSQHVAAENGDINVSDEQLEKLRESMRLTIADAKASKCYECHDLDNSPDFDFDSYWEEVKHEGKD